MSVEGLNEIKYFAYGSNMDPKRMKNREVNYLKREHAILEGWRLNFDKLVSENSNKGNANIEKYDESLVEGKLYTIKYGDLEIFDEHEGFSDHYKKLKVWVKLDNGEKEEAIIYVANSEKVKNGLKPRKNYLNYLLQGCDLLSKKYCENLRKWATLDWSYLAHCFITNINVNIDSPNFPRISDTIQS